MEEKISRFDYFAAMAMQGLLAKYKLEKPEDQQTICQLSCELACELIKQINISEAI